MSDAAKVKGPASYFRRSKRYGQPITHWEAQIATQVGKTHMQVVAWLKEATVSAMVMPTPSLLTSCPNRPKRKANSDVHLHHRFRHADPRFRKTRDPHHRRFSVTVPEGTSIMRAAMEIGTQIPKLCATDSLEAFGSAAFALSRSRDAPAHCVLHHACGGRAGCPYATSKLKDIRKGVMELYISDHPLDCLTCSANGDCELQDMAGAWACARCAMAMMARTTTSVLRRHRQ